METVMSQNMLDHRPSSRPSTARFGQLSSNSFFARHNPHPHRVRHIKGLLDNPICDVTDDGHEILFSARSNSSLSFPPNYFNDTRISTNTKKYNMPVNAINVNSQKYPIDTITGLQYFTAMRSFSMKEKAIPRLGLVPVTENWRGELRALTEAAMMPLLFKQQQQLQQQQQAALNGQQQQVPPRTTSSSGKRQIYSPSTGRLLPPPSRAMSRRSRGRPATGLMMPTQLPPYEHISVNPDIESQVFTMLCQILQTEDVHAVQSWLTSANDREKALVLDIIQSAVSNKDEYYEINPTGEVMPVPSTASRRPKTESDHFLPAINENDTEARVDRLTVHDEKDDVQQQVQQVLGVDTCAEKIEQPAPVEAATFRPPTGTKPSPRKSAESPRLKYTNSTPENMMSTKLQSTWNPDASAPQK